LGVIAALTLAPFQAIGQTGQDKPVDRTFTRPTVITLPVPANPLPVVPSEVSAAPLMPTVGGMRGILVETLEGEVVMSEGTDQAYNPASGTKLATALAALRTYGPNYRFTTTVWTNGTFDAKTGTVTGDLILSGRDPSFNLQNAVIVACELNKMGIRTVTGNLIVPSRFTVNFDESALYSGAEFYDSMDSTRRSANATGAWNLYRSIKGDPTLPVCPHVAIMGGVTVDTVPTKARVLMTHESSKLTDVLKVLLCYSNNFMAERIGEMLGGPEGMRRVLINNFQMEPTDINFATTSGLGVNRVTLRGMMKIFRSLRMELARYSMTPADIMPVAGIDPGTLQGRFTSPMSRGSVVGKTGTLIRTDSGASALVGQMQTASGKTLLFVIFNMHGNIHTFRSFQNEFVTYIQNQYGGPAPFRYQATGFTLRLADTKAQTARTDEYEPGN
jgi:D-alanyl-D-alanine carboxypeptidase/D-alanyl-D-alanine-endopeptidase (penicillin-binding protein 4)